MQPNKSKNPPNKQGSNIVNKSPEDDEEGEDAVAEVASTEGEW